MYTPAILPGSNRARPAQLLPAVASVSGVAGVAGLERSLERNLMASLAGRTVTAMVIGRADDGHGIVDIGGAQITVAADDLPPAGSQVTLKFPGTPQSQAASQASTLARLGAAALPTGANAKDGDVSVELGAGARSLQRFTEGPLTPLPLGSVQASIEEPGQWSGALAQLLRESGTFYESHLAQWTRGRYALADIRREPQAAGAPQAAPQNAQNEAAANLPAHLRLVLPQATQQAQDPVPPSAPAAQANGGGIAEQHHPVIREQLHALETQTLPVSVETWPGQHADLVIAREDEASRAANDVPGWNTTLKLQLPGLGTVSAALSLKGDRLWLDLTATPESAQLMDEADGALAQAMHAAGLRLVRTRIHEQEISQNATQSAQPAPKARHGTP